MGFFDSFFSPSKQTSTTKVEIPKWIEDAGKSNYDFAKSIGDKGFTPFGGQQVAGFSGNQNKAFDLINSITPKSLQTGEFGINMDDIGKFMNPYTQEVTDRAVSDLLRSGEVQKEGLDNQFHGGGEGAFGDARAGAFQAELASGLSREAGNLSANLNSQNFDKALQALIGETSVAGQQQNQATDFISKLFGYGSAEQGQEQSELDAVRSEFDREQAFDDETLNRLMAALSGTPFAKTQTSTTPGPSPFGQVAGGASALASMFI